MYADDSQVYVTTPVTDATTAVARLSAAIVDINDWMKARADYDSTHPRHRLCGWVPNNSGQDRHVPLLSTVVTAVDSARDLGVIIDSQLSMDMHVAALCRSGNFAL